MQLLRVYGFGSFFFPREKPAHDIDLLLLHRDIRLPSIEFAIRCKSLIASAMPLTHIAMLSEAEEHDIAFLSKSQHLLLKTLSDTGLTWQIRQLIAAINYKIY
jgi:hypothetical protein